MPLREVCSPVNKPGGPGGKPQPLPHPDKSARNPKHTAIYERSGASSRPPTPRGATPGE
jgi:hypothetical protein